MNNPNQKNYFVKKDTTIKATLSLLNISPYKCLLVIDENQKLLGTITDGDIRKFIIKMDISDLSTKIDKIYNKKPIIIYKDEIDINKIKRILQFNKFDLIPVLNKSNKVVDIFSWDQFFQIDINDSKISKILLVIMAGGRGKRLAPFTNKYPKALMPIAGVPMIIRILEKYKLLGFNNFIVSVNYQKKILKEEIKNNFLKLTNSKLSFVEESKPLGTIGSIRNIKENLLTEHLVITNCDTIITENFENIFFKHQKNNADITMIVTEKNFDIPYGQIIIDSDSNFIEIKEKPRFKIDINVGFYIIKKEVIRLIPRNKFFNANDLINKAKQKNLNIKTYYISENNWIEVGKTSDLESLNRLIAVD